MVFRKFYLLLLSRVVVLAVNALLLGYFFFRPEFIFTSIFLFAVFIIQVVSLIIFLNRTNSQLATFINYIENEDPQITFREQGSLIRDKQLYKYFSHLSEIITGYRSREKRWQYLLDYSIGNLEAGVMVLAADGRIEVLNKPAKKLLAIRNENNMESIRDADPGLLFAIRSIMPGQRKIYKFRQKDDYRQLLLRSANFRLFDEQLKLVLMQDIRNELQDKELDSWQNLIRVITHEVNNTLSPVTSLTTLLLDQLSLQYNSKGGFEADGEDLCRKTIEGLQIINERNAGLLRFVSEFRSSALPPQITPKHFKVQELFSRTAGLFAKSLSDLSIGFSFVTEPISLTMFADESLLSQVLINLVKNAVDSFDGTEISPKEIACSAWMDENDRVVMEVSDTGPGIPGSITDKIFIPFFTTKEKGSGIGLSFSRQVIRKHHGSIEVFSEPGQGSRFVIKI